MSEQPEMPARFQKVSDAAFVRGEHDVMRFWTERQVFQRLREQNADGPLWSFLDGPITANNPMGVHHAWGRTFKDVYQRYQAMTGHRLRYQNGFDCQGLWVEVEVERELGLSTKADVLDLGIDQFVNACKRRVLRFAARQTEQSIRLGYWMDWDDPDTLLQLVEAVGSDTPVTITTPRGEEVTGSGHALVARLGNPDWGGSYFTFSTENNETIWAFLKKCFERGKLYRGHDVMPWSGRGGSAYSQMEVADGRRLSVHESVFVRVPLKDAENEFLLIWTTTPWTLAANVACAVNPDLDYIRLKATRDEALYYLAADNLEAPRLEREFREGFGRPEWNWPADVPKLKTIAQLFKEQGGYEIQATLKGAELVGREYRGPFDDLPAQQTPGGVPFDETLAETTAAASHRVIDGGRDSKGNPHVVAGEGTGIVHIAPGSGDIDFQLGRDNGLVALAPLAEDGRFTEEFGFLAGLEATDPAVRQAVFDRLAEKELLFATESYPHIYPHCWRTGDELVFRLVDEWFINMDWREEIKDVTRQIRWLPASVDGENRELEWLTNMRDWMISKKRFWGLALPIWVDEETGDFEVIGSLAELKERAVEGWETFEGHTPHRPWIDEVRITNPETGNRMSRIADVGNPWLDAGIVPFSTMQFNTNPSAWAEQYPADFITECFPGQFRNWFYALLAMATMMDGSPPFRNLLGHRLVMNEDGQPMHKSDGTAIWFEEAAEQLGVDTMRWMYLAQNPAVDLRFGTRHPDEPLTLETPAGPIQQTAEGVPTCRVSSRPADEIRRQVLIPLWNSYAFFINYARLDHFDPSVAEIPVESRPEMDRWILSNLQALIVTCRESLEEYNVVEACRASTALIDDLSNWYIRRNRRRFWRSRDDDQGDEGRDKLAAYQTLFTVLLTLSKLLAPMIPFLAERMFRNLVSGDDHDSDVSVHLIAYPEPAIELLDPELNQRMATAQAIVRLGHRLRDEANQRVRQPLPELRFATSDPGRLAAVEELSGVIADELNVKQVTGCEGLDDLVRYRYKPNLKTLGPKYGKLLGAIRQQLPDLDPQQLAPLRSGQSVTLSIDDSEVVLQPEDVLLETEQSGDWVCGDDHDVQVALSTVLSPELIREGLARDFIRHIQQLRKDSGLEIEDRIQVGYHCDDPESLQAIDEWSGPICGETLADELLAGEATGDGGREVKLGSAAMTVWIKRTG
jgi:isoleucyl-tRNA synthetase